MIEFQVLLYVGLIAYLFSKKLLLRLQVDLIHFEIPLIGIIAGRQCEVFVSVERYHSLSWPSSSFLSSEEVK